VFFYLSLQIEVARQVMSLLNLNSVEHILETLVLVRIKMIIRDSSLLLLKVLTREVILKETSSRQQICPRRGEEVIMLRLMMTT
jgi:hypothetical protein